MCEAVVAIRLLAYGSTCFILFQQSYEYLTGKI